MRGNPKIGTLVPWFGNGRTIAEAVGRELEGCSWVGIPFAGGMPEVAFINARTILVNDLHRHVINLARVVADDDMRPSLVRRLNRTIFHPDELRAAQETCLLVESGGEPDSMIDWAASYFIASWVGRSSRSGAKGEFDGGGATRWTSGGGDSAVRFQSAARGVVEWGRIFRGCTFETMDAFDFLAECKDRPGHGIYLDPPFPSVGRKYVFNAGATDADERRWHTRLRDAVLRFHETKVVMRFYGDHPLVQELYPNGEWTWKSIEGRKQTNDAAPEVLLIRNGGS